METSNFHGRRLEPWLVPRRFSSGSSSVTPKITYLLCPSLFHSTKVSLPSIVRPPNDLLRLILSPEIGERLSQPAFLSDKTKILRLGVIGLLDYNMSEQFIILLLLQNTQSSSVSLVQRTMSGLLLPEERTGGKRESRLSTGNCRR